MQLTQIGLLFCVSLMSGIESTQTLAADPQVVTSILDPAMGKIIAHCQSPGSVEAKHVLILKQ